MADVAEIMEFECKDVKKERKHESTDAEKHEGVSSLFLKEYFYEANTIQAIYTTPKRVETLYTKDDVVLEKQTMILEEPHAEWNITLDRDAIIEIHIPTTYEVIYDAKDV